MTIENPNSERYEMTPTAKEKLEIEAWPKWKNEDANKLKLEVILREIEEAQKNTQGGERDMPDREWRPALDVVKQVYKEKTGEFGSISFEIKGGIPQKSIQELQSIKGYLAPGEKAYSMQNGQVLIERQTKGGNIYYTPYSEYIIEKNIQIRDKIADKPKSIVSNNENILKKGGKKETMEEIVSTNKFEGRTLLEAGDEFVTIGTNVSKPETIHTIDKIYGKILKINVIDRKTGKIVEQEYPSETEFIKSIQDGKIKFHGNNKISRVKETPEPITPKPELTSEKEFLLAIAGAKSEKEKGVLREELKKFREKHGQNLDGKRNAKIL